MFNAPQLKTLIIEPVLKHLDMYSPAATNLLLGTCAQESKFGTYLRQLAAGPAVGIYQMEPNTYNDIWMNFIRFHPVLEKALRQLCIMEPDSTEMIGNLYYATAMCRIHYYRVKEALPDAEDIDALALYWKNYYNTKKGKGNPTDFKQNYERYVLETRK